MIPKIDNVEKNACFFFMVERTKITDLSYCPVGEGFGVRLDQSETPWGHVTNCSRPIAAPEI